MIGDKQLTLIFVLVIGKTQTVSIDQLIRANSQSSFTIPASISLHKFKKGHTYDPKPKLVAMVLFCN